MAGHNPTPLTSEDRRKILERLDITHTSGKDWIIRRYEATLRSKESQMTDAMDCLELE